MGVDITKESSWKQPKNEYKDEPNVDYFATPTPKNFGGQSGAKPSNEDNSTANAGPGSEDGGSCKLNLSDSELGLYDINNLPDIYVLHHKA